MFDASLLAWLPEGSEILYDVRKGSFVGLSLHMRMIWSPSNS